jgi:hypothetical protein
VPDHSPRPGFERSVELRGNGPDLDQPLGFQQLLDDDGAGADVVSEVGAQGTVALSDLERRAPQIFRSGPMATDPTAPIRPISVGQGGRLTDWCDSQSEDFLQRDEVDP